MNHLKTNLLFAFFWRCSGGKLKVYHKLGIGISKMEFLHFITKKLLEAEFNQKLTKTVTIGNYKPACIYLLKSTVETPEQRVNFE